MDLLALPKNGRYPSVRQIPLDETTAVLFRKLASLSLTELSATPIDTFKMALLTLTKKRQIALGETQLLFYLES